MRGIKYRGKREEHTMSILLCRKSAGQFAILNYVGLAVFEAHDADGFFGEHLRDCEHTQGAKKERS